METLVEGKLKFKRSSTAASDTLLPLESMEEFVEFTQERLQLIMRTLVDERKQYERTMAHTLQELQIHYEERLAEKERLIGELSLTIDLLISNSKHMELEHGRKVGDYEQEIQTYKNLLRRKYLKEIDMERQQKREAGPRSTVRKVGVKEDTSPDSLRKMISQMQFTEASKISLYVTADPEANFSGNKYKQSGECFIENEPEPTRASTLANKTSQLLSALKLRTNPSKQSAFIKRKSEIDSSIKTVNSTFVPKQRQPQQNL